MAAYVHPFRSLEALPPMHRRRLLVDDSPATQEDAHNAGIMQFEGWPFDQIKVNDSVQAAVPHGTAFSNMGALGEDMGYVVFAVFIINSFLSNGYEKFGFAIIQGWVLMLAQFLDVEIFPKKKHRPRTLDRAKIASIVDWIYTYVMRSLFNLDLTDNLLGYFTRTDLHGLGIHSIGNTIIADSDMAWHKLLGPAMAILEMIKSRIPSATMRNDFKITPREHVECARFLDSLLRTHNDKFTKRVQESIILSAYRFFKKERGCLRLQKAQGTSDGVSQGVMKQTSLLSPSGTKRKRKTV